jgi:hypothetical protein
MVQKPSHVKQLSPIHVCKIGLMYLFCEEFLFICATDSTILKEAHTLLLRLSWIIPPPHSSLSLSCFCVAGRACPNKLTVEVFEPI